MQRADQANLGGALPVNATMMQAIVPIMRKLTGLVT